MSDDAQRELREVQAHFRLPSVGLVEKDLQVVRAIAAVAAIDAAPFTLVFGGGTALARAHKLVRRMSEDVDFKIVPAPAAPVTRSLLRQRLGLLREGTDTCSGITVRGLRKRKRPHGAGAMRRTGSARPRRGDQTCAARAWSRRLRTCA